MSAQSGSSLTATESSIKSTTESTTESASESADSPRPPAPSPSAPLLRARADVSRPVGVDEPRAVIERYLTQLTETLDALSREDIAAAADILAQACLARRRVYVCGNGGSAATASHMVNDLSKQATVEGIPAIRAHSLNDNVPLVTAWSNDEDYSEAFARQLECHVEPGDVVIGISTSGNSANVVRALEVARAAGARTIGMTGNDGGVLASIVDCCLFVPSMDIGHQEDVHLVMNHAIAHSLRARLSAR